MLLNQAQNHTQHDACQRTRQGNQPTLNDENARDGMRVGTQRTERGDAFVFLDDASLKVF